MSCADDQFLGIDGQFFVQKVAAAQIFTVLLQGSAKLGVMARIASMTGALSPIFATFDPLLVPSYWIFLVALVGNAIYPSVLLTSKSKHLQREVAAQCDAALGVTYFIVYCIATWVTNSLSRTFPLTPYEYVATIFPLVHILGVARALEENAKPLPMKRPGLERARSTSAMETRLPPRVSVGHVVIALGIVAVIFVRTVIEGLYPFDDWHRACRPCDCDGSVLVSCDVPNELETVLLYLEGRGITDIAKNSLGKTLQSFSLARNDISTLAPEALSSAEYLGFLNLGRNRFHALNPVSFESNSELRGLDLQSNNISTIEESAWPDSLVNLALRGNRIRELPAGLLDARGLRFLFIDDNGMREVEAGAFDLLPRLEHVWFGGNELDCASASAALPASVVCMEDRCDDGEFGLMPIGDGFCSEGQGVLTKACAWDGGDCDS